MNKIGIMQGRILPDQTEKLQVFPCQNWKKEFELASKIGFDYIELLYDRDEEKDNPLMDINRYSEIVELTQDANLEIHSICADYFTKVCFLHKGEITAWEKLEYLVNLASKIGVQNIVIPFFDQNKLLNQSDLENFLQSAENIINQAQKVNLNLCIETDLSASEMLGAINQTQSFIKVCYDLGNAVAFGYVPEDEIKLLGDLITLVHIKDRLKNNGKNVFINKGAVDFESAFQTLKQINYQGCYTLETAIGVEPTLMAEKHYNIIEQLVL